MLNFLPHALRGSLAGITRMPTIRGETRRVRSDALSVRGESGGGEPAFVLLPE